MKRELDVFGLSRDREHRSVSGVAAAARWSSGGEIGDWDGYS